MRIFLLETGTLKLDGGAMFGVVPKSIWQKHYPADENNLCTWAMRCLLLELADKLILVDTGMGNKQDASFFAHYHPDYSNSLEKSLDALGYSSTDITDVLLTHLHFDHAGGALMRKQEQIIPSFPNANYWISHEQWHEALNPNQRERASFLPENFLPLQNSSALNLIHKHDQPFHGIDCEFYYGHTRAMIILKIILKAQIFYYVADLIPSVGHLKIAYVPAYDIDPLRSMQEKQYFLKRCIEQKAILLFEHDPYIEACNLEYDNKGQIIAGKKGKLSSFLN